MADKLTVIAFMLDTPGGTRRRRVMVRFDIPRGAPKTLVIPDTVEQSQTAITDYIAATTSTPADAVSWRHPLPS